MASQKTYAVLTCDVIESRKFDPIIFSAVLNDVLDKANRTFSKFLHRRLSVMFGDSIQTVVKAPHVCFDIFEALEELLWLSGAEKFGKKRPIMLRCGIGIGGIDNPSAVLGEMNGDAFVFARNALDSMRNQRKRSRAAFRCENEELSHILSSAMNLISIIKSRWSFRVREYMMLRRRKMSVTDIAKKERVSYQAVTKALSANHCDAVIMAEADIRSFLCATQSGCISKMQPNAVEQNNPMEII